MPLLLALTLIKLPVSLEVYGDGNELTKAERYARKHGLKVKFYGRVEHAEILKKMKKAQLSSVVSYGFDNQPMTILEARAMGLPTLVCDPDLLEVTGDSGILTAGPEPEKIAETLENIQRRPETIAEKSKECIKERDEVLQSVQIKKLIKLYNDLASKMLPK